MSDDDSYEVEQILGHRKKRLGKGFRDEFLIRWKGFGSEHDTWEPRQNLTGCKDLLKEFQSHLESESETELMTPPPTTAPKRFSSIIEESASKTLEAAEIITRRRLQVGEGHKAEKLETSDTEEANGVKTISEKRLHGKGVSTNLPWHYIFIIAASLLLVGAVAGALFYTGSVTTLKEMWSHYSRSGSVHADDHS